MSLLTICRSTCGYKGQYYATTLSQVNAEDYHLIGWYDSLGCAAGGKIRVLIAVKND